MKDKSLKSNFLEKKRKKPVLIVYDEREVPHLVIEVNQKCNIHCKACYKSLSDYTKPLELIKKEIEFALTKRKVKLITLAGGEPTLHPQLSEVIQFISSKGIKTRLLTNGFDFTKEQLSAYKKAGLNSVFLHIDSLQNRPDRDSMEHEGQLNILRDKICNQVMEAGLDCRLEVTLYQKNLLELESIVSFILTHASLHRMLVTCFTDFQKIAYFYNHDIRNFRKEDFDGQAVVNQEVERFLYEHFGMVPYAYMGSSHNLNEKRWVYFGAITIHRKDKKSKILHFTPEHKHLIRVFQKFSKNKEDSIDLKKRSFLGRWMMIDIISAIFLTDVDVLLRFISFLSGVFVPGSKLNIKNFIFQQGPNLRDDGQIEYCHNCPDATVRDGELTVLCLVDQIDPEKRIKL